MAGNRNIFQKVLNAAIFILMEVAALNMIGHNAALQNIWLTRGSHRIMGALWGTSESLRYYFSLKKQNETLAQENFDLRQALLRAGKDVRPAEVPDSSAGSFTYIPAEISVISRNKQHNYMIINKGYEDGIQPNSGIITGKGVVGIIDAVEKRHAYALTFMNTDVSISARLGTEGAVGPLVWDGLSSTGAILKEIPLQFKYEPGDTVYTSGYSSIFPSDIPLGVAGESRIINGATNEIKVRLLQDFSALRFVTVVHNNDLKEMEALLQ